MTRRSTPQAKIDRDAFPVVLRVLIPETGTWEWGRGNDPEQWLRLNVGPGQYATVPHQNVLGDGVAYLFRSVEDAVAFQARFPMMVLADATMSETYTSPYLPFGRREAVDVCNLYAHTRSQDAMRRLFAGLSPVDRLGNLPELSEIYPDYLAPILRNTGAGTELVMARWGLPTPPQFLLGKRTDRGVTNVRNTGSPHWRRWLGPANRCLVPITSFAEPNPTGGNAWFDLPEDQPAVFAGIHVPAWTSTRKLKDGETTDDLFAFLTTEPNAEVGAVHPKAMPVILTDPAEWSTWLMAPWSEAAQLQRLLQNRILIRKTGALHGTEAHHLPA